jgi:hypothetical protein
VLRCVAECIVQIFAQKVRHFHRFTLSILLLLLCCDSEPSPPHDIPMISKEACDCCWSVKQWEFETFDWQFAFVSSMKSTTNKLILDSLQWVGNPVFDSNDPSSFLDVILRLLLALLARQCK